MNQDFVVLMAASKRVESEARSALPDSPQITDHIQKRSGPRLAGLRLQVSRELHVIAERISPAPVSLQPATTPPSSC